MFGNSMMMPSVQTDSLPTFFLTGGNAGRILRTENGSTWTTIATIGTQSMGGGIITPNVWMVYGLGGALYTSTNQGGSWVQRTTGFGGSGIMAIDYSPTLNLFCIVGQNGQLATSADNGATWQIRSSNTTGQILDVIWVQAANNGAGEFLIATNFNIIRSANGVSWTTSSSGTTFDVPVPPFFLAHQQSRVMTGHTSNLAFESVNAGIHFSSLGLSGAFATYGGCYSFEGTRLFASLQQRIFRESAVVLNAGTAGRLSDIAQLANGTLVAIGNNGTNLISYTSTNDGATWTQNTTNFASNTANIFNRLSRFRG